MLSTLVNRARRHRKGLPIGSAIAEAAVNEVVSWRMARKRQMRRSDEGAPGTASIRPPCISIKQPGQLRHLPRTHTQPPLASNRQLQCPGTQK